MYEKTNKLWDFELGENEMWIYDKIHFDDLNTIVKNNNIPWSVLDGKTIFVTGATGLIGQNIVNTLLYYGKLTKKPPKVIALVRNIEKAKLIFSQQLEDCDTYLRFVVSDITSYFEIEEKIDYIIHGASETSSASFIEKPVETIDTAFFGTKNMLELARKHNVTSFVYLSSMEAYGSPKIENSLKESDAAYFDSMSVRSSYPESKRMCETLCCAYTSEYNVPVKVVRLAQTFGYGISKDDKRVFADFARKAIKGEDILLLTRGESKRMYLYTMDAVSAILMIMLKGENGNCYNAANKDTYCTIKEMAKLVLKTLSTSDSKIIINCDDTGNKKYSPEHDLNLDVSKLERLNWKAYINLENMYKKMAEGLKDV